MSDWPGLDRFLAADPRDVGCEQALEILDVYVEMVLEDAPGLAARRFPGVAVHLAACGPCDEDFQGRQLTSFGSPALAPRWRADRRVIRTLLNSQVRSARRQAASGTAR